MDSQNLSEEQKLTYLFMSLEGKAKAAVEGYTLSPGNCTLTMDVLERFGQVETIKATLRQELAGLAAIGKSSNDIRSLLEKVKRIVLQLERLGENHPYFEFLIKKKLSYWALLKVCSAQEGDSTWNMKKASGSSWLFSDSERKYSNVLW